MASGVPSWISDARTTTLIMSEAPSSDQRGERQRKPARQAEHDRHGAEHRHRERTSSVPRGVAAAGATGSRPWPARRWPARIAGSPGPGAGVQDVLGVDRQQRGDAAQQHRDHVERDRAQHRLPAANERQPREYRLAASQVRAGAAALVANAAGQQRGCDEHRGAGAVGPRRSGDVDEAPDGRADDDRRLRGRGAGSHRAGQQPGGTSAGSIACSDGVSNARTPPTTNTSAKIAYSVIQPVALPAASSSATSASTAWQTRAMRRRS